MEEQLCGAKTRKGTPCRKKPRANGRCNQHGGKSTGPKDIKAKSKAMKGNKNAVKTGEYETITYATLSEKEKRLYDAIPDDPLAQTRGRYKMMEIRTLRLAERYAKEIQKKKPDMALLESLENAWSRIDGKTIETQRLIRELRLEQQGEATGVTPLDELVKVLEVARVERQQTKMEIKHK